MKKVLIILAVVALLAGGFFAYKKYKKPSGLGNPDIPFSNPTKDPAIKQAIKEDQKTQIETATKSVPSSVIVYKTKRDYSGLVWAYLSADKTQVIAYPTPQDIQKEIPVSLHGGYYSGVLNINSAIINLKIDAYSKLKKAFTPRQMYSIILNKNPFAEMYDCGQKGTDTDPAHINELIDANKLASECDKVI